MPSKEFSERWQRFEDNVDVNALLAHTLGGGRAGVNFQAIDDWQPMLERMGTMGIDMVLNKADSCGDGDQASFPRAFPHAQFFRELWSHGADQDSLNRVSPPKYTPFIFACLLGNVPDVTRMLAEATDKRTLIETRHNVLRQSAIFFTIVGLLLYPLPAPRGNLRCMELLVENGARVDAKDLLGKTVLHYLLGPLFTAPHEETMRKMIDLCVRTAHVLPVPIKLIDIPDRFGAVPIQAAIMCFNMTLLRHCCDTYKANVDIKDADGCCALMMGGKAPGTPLYDILNKRKTEQDYQEFRHTCGPCGKVGTESSLMMCSGCRKVRYCSKTCQSNDWKIHKSVCILMTATPSARAPAARSTPAAAVPTATAAVGDNSVAFSPNLHGSMCDSQVENPHSKNFLQWRGGIPAGLKVGTFFDIKIQEGGGPGMPLLLYNENRTVLTYLEASNCPSFSRLYTLIKSFQPCSGRKVYLRAAFRDHDKIFISLLPAFVCKW